METGADLFADDFPRINLVQEMFDGTMAQMIPLVKKAAEDGGWGKIMQKLQNQIEAKLGIKINKKSQDWSETYQKSEYGIDGLRNGDFQREFES